MKAFDVVLLILSILWVLFYSIRIWVMLGSREVKYGGYKVTIGWNVIFFPIIAWLIIAYRVGG